MWGILTLISYLFIRETFESGPLYAMLPLPVMVLLFWYRCESKYKVPSTVSGCASIAIEQTFRSYFADVLRSAFRNVRVHSRVTVH